VSLAILPLHVNWVDVSPPYVPLHALRESDDIPASRQVIDVSLTYVKIHAIWRESSDIAASRQLS
jgi:hypothetical protein